MAVKPLIAADARGVSSALVKYVIPARSSGNNIKSYPATGDFFYVKELYRQSNGVSVQDVLISTESTVKTPYNVGTGERFQNGSQFDRIEIENPNDFEVYIELLVGWSTFIDNRLNIVRTRPESIQPVIEAETEVAPWVGAPAGTYEIPASSSVEFAPVLTGRRILQKAITIANADPNSALRLLDENDEPFGRIIANSSQIFPISGTVKVENETGTAIVAYIGQIYWLNPAP